MADKKNTSSKKSESGEDSQMSVDQQVDALFAIHRQDPPSTRNNWKLVVFVVGVSVSVLLIMILSLP